MPDIAEFLKPAAQHIKPDIPQEASKFMKVTGDQVHLAEARTGLGLIHQTPEVGVDQQITLPEHASTMPPSPSSGSVNADPKLDDTAYLNRLFAIKKTQQGGKKLAA